MRKVHLLSLLVVAVAMGLWAAPGWADEGPIRVALVVHAQAPLSDDSPVARAVFSVAHRGLESVERLHLIPQDRIVAAQRVLGFHLTADSSPRQVRALADLLDADAVVLIQLSLVRDGLIVLHGLVFSAEGRVLVEFRSAVFRPDVEEQIQRAVKEFLEKIIPALLRL